MYESYYHEQLAKISTCVKYSIDAYHRYILPRYMLPFCFGNLNFRNYHGDSRNVMFPRFPNCFQPFPLVFPHVSPGFLLFPGTASIVSYFRFCGDIIPFGLRIKKNPGINMISSDFMNIRNSALNIAEKCLVETLLEETEKFVAFSDTAFDSSLKEVFSENILVGRARVIKNGKHVAEILHERTNFK